MRRERPEIRRYHVEPVILAGVDGQRDVVNGDESVIGEGEGHVHKLVGLGQAGNIQRSRAGHNDWRRHIGLEGGLNGDLGLALYLGGHDRPSVAHGLQRQEGLNRVGLSRRHHGRPVKGSVLRRHHGELIGARQQAVCLEQAIGAGDTAGDDALADRIGQGDNGIGQRRGAVGEESQFIDGLHHPRAVGIGNGVEHERHLDAKTAAIDGQAARIGSQGQVRGWGKRQGHEVGLARTKGWQGTGRCHMQPWDVGRRQD